MLARHKVTQNSPQVTYTLCLLSYKYNQPVSPLECALPQFLATVHSKELTRSANSFRMRAYTKTGGRGARPFPPRSSPFTKGNMPRIFVPLSTGILKTCNLQALRLAAPLFSTTSKMLLRQPSSSQTLALSPGWGIPLPLAYIVVYTSIGGKPWRAQPSCL